MNLKCNPDSDGNVRSPDPRRLAREETEEGGAGTIKSYAGEGENSRVYVGMYVYTTYYSVFFRLHYVH